jgi:hypothetical protein
MIERRSKGCQPLQHKRVICGGLFFARVRLMLMANFGKLAVTYQCLTSNWVKANLNCH